MSSVTSSSKITGTGGLQNKERHNCPHESWVVGAEEVGGLFVLETTTTSRGQIGFTVVAGVSVCLGLLVHSRRQRAPQVGL